MDDDASRDDPVSTVEELETAPVLSLSNFSRSSLAVALRRDPVAADLISERRGSFLGPKNVKASVAPCDFIVYIHTR